MSENPASPAASQRAAYRPEIDGLRAIAVLAVILFHFSEDLLPGGLHGVDFFFVISGYVITGFLFNSRATDWKTFLVNFYAKRVKRLFPALFAMIAVYSLMVLLLINPTANMGTYSLVTGAAALASFSNVYLLLIRFDYFGLNAQLNFFSHTWSLGVEEQFYLVFPIVLLATGFVRIGRIEEATRTRNALIFLSACSFGIFVLAGGRPSGFYLMPARFWELGLGSLAFLASSRAASGAPTPRTASRDVISLVLFAILLVSLTVPVTQRAYTLPVVVLCTFGLMFYASGGSSVCRVLSSGSMVGIGKLSYSLYLWHWPILLASGYLFGSTRSVGQFIALGVATLAASLLSYLLREKPLRYRTWALSGGREIGMAVLTAAGLAWALVAVGKTADIRRPF